MKNRATIIVMIVAIVAIVVVAGVMINQNKSDSDKTGTTKTSPPQSDLKTESDNSSDAVATDEVEIEDFAFSPAKITVKVGTTVTWTNKDSVEHTVTADDSSADGPNSALLGKDEGYSFTFTKAGTFNYFCKPHPHMRGTVVVTE